MKIVVSDPEGRFLFQEAPEPQPQAGELLVRVLATSLNPRDLRMARARPGYRSGVDFAGVVERAAGRSGPQAGSQVAGVMPSGAWAELLAVAPRTVAPIEPGLSAAQAAAMASVGLTALYALARGGDLLGRRVLITGAAGSVGQMACQLASLAGAQVVASVRSAERAQSLAGTGVEVAVGPDPTAAASFGPFDLILESVGGASLSASAKLLAPGGTCVVLGSTAGGPSAIDAAELYQNHRSLVGFGLFVDLNARPASEGLRRLFRLAADGRLSMPVGATWPWSELNEAAAAMEAGRIAGKVVLEVA